jgi:hypothetical protein
MWQALRGGHIPLPGISNWLTPEVEIECILEEVDAQLENTGRLPPWALEAAMLRKKWSDEKTPPAVQRFEVEAFFTKWRFGGAEEPPARTN